MFQILVFVIFKYVFAINASGDGRATDASIFDFYNRSFNIKKSSVMSTFELMYAPCVQPVFSHNASTFGRHGCGNIPFGNAHPVAFTAITSEYGKAQQQTYQAHSQTTELPTN
ncbi:MAG: hypothetical protein OEM61_05355 [Desulfobacteraceae bacterium]|jgi:hypothetical protein|nr:hypothetical protein [Desulfobacteraceae bacterium]